MMTNFRKKMIHELAITDENCEAYFLADGREAAKNYLERQYEYMTGMIAGAQAAFAISGKDATELTSMIEEEVSQLFEIIGA